MLTINGTVQTRQECSLPAAMDPQTCEDIKTKCEAARAELADVIKELSNVITARANQHKQNNKEIELHHNLCAVSRELTKTIGTLNNYFIK